MRKQYNLNKKKKYLKIFELMGQYYQAILLDKTKEKIIGWQHSLNGGAKLMEHSWLKNDFVCSFESLILNNPMSVVWAGDYADNEKDSEENLYSLCEPITKLQPTTIIKTKSSRYVINHDKKEYVDKFTIPDKDGWKIHPLPILTAEGNGRGGGDLRSDSLLIGRWARDIIEVSNTKPEEYKILIFNLTEE